MKIFPHYCHTVYSSFLETLSGSSQTYILSVVPSRNSNCRYMVANSGMQIPVRLLLMGLTLMSPVGADDAHLSSQKCAVDPSNSTTETIYRFSERELNGNRTIRLSRYTGKVCLRFYYSTNLSRIYSRSIE